MASGVVVMSNNAVIHPFFAKDHKKLDAEQPRAIENEQGIFSGTDPTAHTESQGVESNVKPSKSKARTRKHESSTRTQPTLQQVLHIPGMPSVDTPNETTIADESDHPRKRRKTSTESLKQTNSEAITADDAPELPDTSAASAPLPLEEPELVPRQEDFVADSPTRPRRNATRATQTPPKKLLRLNGTGKFSSPVTKSGKENTSSTAAGPVKKRRGKAKQKELVVRIKYQQHSAIGQQIDNVLAGRISVKVDVAAPKKVQTPRKPAKSTHPFFTDKPKITKAMPQASPRKAAASTPGKLRTQTRGEQDLHLAEPAQYESTLLKDRLLVKQAGAKEPLWPAKGINHVRALTEDEVPRTSSTLRRRKFKSIQSDISSQESLLTAFASSLVPEPETRLRADGFREPALDLRLPWKLLISGTEIARRVLTELHANPAAGPADELAPDFQSPAHAALVTTYQSIPAYLSEFDNLRGDPLGWANRYAPTTAETVLQPAKEMKVLKSWLQALTVNTVDFQKEHNPDGKASKPKKKRKPRPADLDDFIVDEDDDVRSFGALSDTESTKEAQSVVQNHVTGVKLSNALLISGPNGCGKTAAVYAVAKELNYRVFEISSAERRSGKDVLDKIGNVTENHIVKHHAANANVPERTTIEETEKIDVAFKKDLENGRQGKMSAFFKPSSSQTKTITKPSKTSSKSQTLKSVQKALRPPPKEQQQSLIFLEEVDILFKEDKEFWSTVLKLVLSSKRPFVMTCNDEDLVPIQAMSLHAILRLSPPPVDLAVDYLLMVAAKEGHLLKRKPILDLWKHSQHNLRRCLNTLDFWCRMGVGDIRNGLDWILQRWPVGSDLDEHGRPIRVVSVGTYQSGMGVDTTQPESLQDAISAQATGPADSDMTLSQMCDLADCMSDIDVFSTAPWIDPSAPPLSEKSRAHFIEGMAILDVQSIIDFDPLRDQLQPMATDLVRRLYDDRRVLDGPRKSARQLSRKDFAVFDVLAAPLVTTSTPDVLRASVFDGPLCSITVDVAPYVRQIVRFDLALEEQRNALAGPSKKIRKTRAARSALEGGQRQLTRRAEWFEGAGDLRGTLVTAGIDWHLQQLVESDSLVGTPASQEASSQGM